jgi:glucose/arabinose dehydrogenase/mono/diheme cytochrome c family protein
MTPGKATGTTALVFGAFLFTVMATAPRGQAPAPQAPAAGPAQPAAAGGPGPAQGGGGGGGRGRGNAAQALYAEHCGGCHGNDAAGGRAASLFDEVFLKSRTDEQLVAAIRDGIPNTEMEPFGKALTPEQIWSLVVYVKTFTGGLRPRPAFVGNPDGTVLKTEKQTVRVETVIEGLETPFGLEFLPGGRLLVTERPGRLRVWADGKLSEPVKGTPAVNAVQDGGLLDVIAHPNYAQNGWIYLAYTERQPGYTPPPPAEPAPAAATGAAPVGNVGAPQGRGRGPQVPSMTVVVRGKINANNEWTDQQFIYRADPSLYTGSGAHFGLRFIWDRDGHLFYSIGDRGSIPNAQNMQSAFGKIHRVNDDGSPVKDNPFVGQPGVPATIWSVGHRNPQGLAWHPVTGKLWESEHGPNSADEINVIEKGANYGWGVATKAAQAGMVSSAPGMIDPVIYYTPTMATAGISFYTGDRYPAWKNTSLFVGGLLGERLERLETDGDKVTHQEVIFNNFGRVRDITQGPDGYLYIALQNPTGGTSGVPGGLSASTPGRVIRLVPQQ